MCNGGSTDDKNPYVGLCGSVSCTNWPQTSCWYTRTYNDNSGQACSSIESLTGCQSRNGNLAVKHGEARPWSRTAADPTEILFDHLTPAGLSVPATTRKKEVKGKKKSVQKEEE